MSNRGLFQFGFGTLLSTPIFMTFVVVLGALGGKFLPDMVVNIMNLVVGCLLVFWGLRYIFPQFELKPGKKEK